MARMPENQPNLLIYFPSGDRDLALVQVKKFVRLPEDLNYLNKALESDSVIKRFKKIEIIIPKKSMIKINDFAKQHIPFLLCIVFAQPI